MLQRGGMIAGAVAAALLIFAAGARADLLTNGSFENTANVMPPAFPDSSPGNTGSGGVGMIDYNTSVTGWSSPSMSFADQTGYNFIFSPSTASTSGAVGYNGSIALSGPGNGNNNGLVASPDGGQFVGADADPRYNGAIQQTVSGLTAGQEYNLSFSWAGAQLFGGAGTPTESWQVSLGSQTLSTSTLTLPSVGGFTGWQQANLTFTASAGSEVLGFLAIEAAPPGGQPMTLLDGVSLVAVPEPTSLGLLAIGLLTMLAGPLVLRRKTRRRG